MNELWELTWLVISGENSDENRAFYLGTHLAAQEYGRAIAREYLGENARKIVGHEDAYIKGTLAISFLGLRNFNFVNAASPNGPVRVRITYEQ